MKSFFVNCMLIVLLGLTTHESAQALPTSTVPLEFKKISKLDLDTTKCDSKAASIGMMIIGKKVVENSIFFVNSDSNLSITIEGIDWGNGIHYWVQAYGFSSKVTLEKDTCVAKSASEAYQAIR